MSELHPLDLARLPTPLERLPRPSARLGLDIWVKRDDLTGLALSGNKVRKLAWLLADARQRGATALVTTGGIQSNHCRATAASAARLGLRCVLLLRGTPPAGAELDGNLLLDAFFGAEVHWCTPEGYLERDARMADIAAGLRAEGEVPYVIAEGGSSALGALGFARACDELRAQQPEGGFDSVVCAVGSGGTLAGLAMGGLRGRVLGIAVCDDAPTFRQHVREIAAEASHLGLRLPPSGPDTWDVLEDWRGPAYGETTPAAWRQHAVFSRETGLLLDPVYTGKAWAAVEDLAVRDPARLGRRVLFWHTGGAYGLFGRGGELAAALGPELAARGVVREA
jgi:D-cysteine desulfhydrase